MTKQKQSILFFADRLPPLVGGMEMHAGAFLEFFKGHSRYPLDWLVTKDYEENDCLISEGIKEKIAIDFLNRKCDPALIFFNSGCWIEQMKQLRVMFPKCLFIYRTGGNEILKAPLKIQTTSFHKERQNYWTNTLNETVDVLITNSAFTESRLREIGIKCRFERFVGGVDSFSLKQGQGTPSQNLTFFSAARFVPYKNHTLLLSIFHQLMLKGYAFKLHLAGDGPLLAEAKKQVEQTNLTPLVTFLGRLDNKSACNEIARAHIYIQLSKDHLTEVPGGAYLHAEGMGRSILEAITAGTFVVAGKSGALSEIVTSDRGILVDVEDCEAIINTLEAIFLHPPKRGLFSDVFEWNHIFQHYVKLWDAIL